jgi:hypothetical protein
MEHFSERFKRNFQDGDWLTRTEVAAVLTANSGRPVSIEYVSDIARRENAHVQIIENKHLYLYDDIKELEVSLKRGPKGELSQSPVAQRQRAFRARQQEKKRQASQ